MKKGNYLYFGKTFLALHLHLFVFIMLALSYGNSLFAQGNLGLGTAAPDSSAILHMQSTDKGVLVPSMTTAQRDSISRPCKGLLIFNSANNRFEFNAGTKSAPNWVALTSMGGVNDSLKTGIINVTCNFDVPLIQKLAPGIVNYQEVDVPVNGAKPGSTVFVSPSDNLPLYVYIAYAFVSSENNVRIRFMNSDMNSYKNPDSMDYYITIIR